MLRVIERFVFVAVFAFAVLVRPAAAYDSPYWLGEYFASADLAGTPVQMQAVGAIAFDWGRSSPGAGLPVDGFSARWSRPVDLPYGVYRITARADDGVRVFVDDRLVLDEWRDGPLRTTDVDVALGGAHLLRVEYYERGDLAAVTVTIDRIVEQPTRTPDAWHAEYFNNPSLSGAPVFTRDEDGRTRNGFDYDYGGGSPDPRVAHDGFSARWSRRMGFVSGYYRVVVRIDDGVRVYIGDRLVLEDWRDGPLRVAESPALFLAGDNSVRVEYYERAGNAAVRVDFVPSPAIATPAPSPTPRSYANWRGEYFGNAALSGAPTLARSDYAINFDWGQGAPAAGLPADEFSVRWSRRVRFSPGSYRFHVRVDDGVRLYVDGRLLIDDWREGAPRMVAADVQLFGSAEVRVEYFDRKGGALIQMTYERIDRTFSDWKAEYFAGSSFEGAPILVRNDPTMNFEWGAGAPAPWLPADEFSVRWTRSQYFAAGWQRFAITVDDGMRVFLDGALLIDQWRDGAVRSVDRVVWLGAGRHDLRVEYYEHAGGAIARFDVTASAAPTITPAP